MIRRTRGPVNGRWNNDTSADPEHNGYFDIFYFILEI
jgi:hypothetical protein